MPSIKKKNQYDTNNRTSSRQPLTKASSKSKINKCCLYSLFSKNKNTYTFKPGEMIYQQGHPFFSLFYVVSGIVKITNENKHGKVTVQRLVRKGVPA